jgi:large subunit ribosomal protein L31e
MPKKQLEPATRDYTIVLHRLCHKTQFKKKAPKALKVIKQFAQKNMGTQDVRVDVKLNQYVWSKGIRNVPKRIRVRLVRKRNEDDEAGKELFTQVQLINVESFAGLKTEKNSGKEEKK